MPVEFSCDGLRRGERFRRVDGSEDDAAAVVDRERMLVAGVEHDLAVMGDAPATPVDAREVLLDEPRIVGASGG